MDTRQRTLPATWWIGPALLAQVLVCGALAGRALAEGSEMKDLRIVRDRLRLELLARPPSPGAVRRWLAAQRPDGSWADVTYDDKSPARWQPIDHLNRLFEMARAACNPVRDVPAEKAGAAAGAALDYWLAHDFQSSNWWWNRIGAPRELGRAMLILQEDLAPAQLAAGIERLKRTEIGMTGQNLVWVSEIVAVRGMLADEPALATRALARIAAEVRTSTAEGIQGDFSFHQHGNCLYNHGYGAGFALDATRVAALVRGTAMAFPADKAALLCRYVLDGSQWMARGPTADYGADGREITRPGQNARYLGAAAENLLTLDTGRDEELRGLVGRAAGRGEPLVGNRHFWRSDLMTHHRPGYYTSARMHSTRMDNTDDPCNAEGLRSHHIADGCNLLVRHGGEYADIFPVWDWKKIPGTTVAADAPLTGSPRHGGKGDFVGGVSDGRYGLAAMDLANDDLSCRKAWFFFDDEYVCLGAGIRAARGGTIITTVNQCFLKGDVTAGDGQTTQTLERGTHTLGDARWVHHDGVACILPAGGDVRVSNREQTGSWSLINRSAPATKLTHDVFTLWLVHAPEPQGGARYAYIVAPGLSARQAAAAATAPPVEVLSNTPQLQAVRRRKGPSHVQAAFYEPGVLKAGEAAIAVDRPCLLLLRETDKGLVLAVADPTQKRRRVQLTLPGAFAGEGCQVDAGRNETRLTLPLPQGPEAGRSVVREIQRQPQPK